MFITQPKIFISSIVFDLINERTAAYNAVNKVGGFPVISEKTMEAQSTDSLNACLSKAMESDTYILILGSRYDWQPEGKESITELEYQTERIRPANYTLRHYNRLSTFKNNHAKPATSI